LDRVGASYDRTIESINCAWVQYHRNAVAIGMESSFLSASLTLMTMKAIFWDDELGREPREAEILLIEEGS